MSIIKSLLFSVISLCALSVPAQQTRILNADKHNEYGLVYTLPVTSVRFDVTARQTVRKAGPYYQYAKKFIGSDNVIKEDAEIWEIISVKATPFGIPDTENKYLMQLKPGALTYICVDDNGMLLAINKEVTSPRLEEAEGETEFKGGVNVRAFLQYMNEDFIASQSSARQAQTLSENLMEVREAKIALTRGTAETMPTDGRQLELMLKSLEDQEKLMTAAFMGSEESRTVTRSFTFTPDEEGRFVLFRMSDFAGFVEPDDYSGDPVYINVKATREAELPVDAKGETKKIPKDAVIYNIPGAVMMSLELNGKSLWKKEVECSQLGMTFGLLPSMFSDKKGRSFATFNPATGALTEIGEVNAE